MNSTTFSNSSNDCFEKSMNTQYKKIYTDISVLFNNIIDNILKSKKALKVWNNEQDKNTSVYIARLLFNYFKMPPISQDNYNNMISVLSHLKISSKSKELINKIKYIRSASYIYINNAISYTGFNSVINFDYVSGKVKNIDYQDVTDFLNENGHDVVSVIQVNVSSYLIMCLDQEKLSDYIKNLNNRIVDIEDDNGNIGVFKTRTFVFDNVKKLPITEIFSWKMRKNESHVIVPIGNKTANVPIENIKQWNQIKRAYSKL